VRKSACHYRTLSTRKATTRSATYSHSSLEELGLRLCPLHIFGVCRTMLCIITAYAVVRCLSVCLSVRVSITFVFSVETSKHIFKNFSPPSSYTILVFQHQTLWKYSDGTPPPNGGFECRWGRQKSRFSNDIWLHRVLSTVQPLSVIHTSAPDRGVLVTLIGGSSKPKRWSLLMAETDDEVFMTKSVNVTPKATEQNVIVRSGKSEAKD